MILCSVCESMVYEIYQGRCLGCLNKYVTALEASHAGLLAMCEQVLWDREHHGRLQAETELPLATAVNIGKKVTP